MPKKSNNVTEDPEFIRVADAVQRFALSRGKLYALMSAGKIAYASLREKGQIKGSRLIKLASLRAYLDKRTTEATTAA